VSSAPLRNSAALTPEVRAFYNIDAMVKATVARKCDYLGRVPKNVKFQVVKVLEDGSYLSWISPDGKSKKKGATRIMVLLH
jgi:hypothetical protein